MNFNSRYNLILKKQRVWLLTLAFFFILGIIFGVIFSKESEKLLFIDNSNRFFACVLTGNQSIFKLLLSRILNSFSIFIIFALAGLNIYTLYSFHGFLIFYRGYVLGIAGVIFFIDFGLTGGIIYVFAILIQNLILSLALIGFSCCCLNRLQSCLKQKIDLQLHIKEFVIFYLLALIGIIVEFLMIILVLRPLNFYF